MQIIEPYPGYKIMDIPERKAMLGALDDYYQNEKTITAFADSYFDSIIKYVKFLKDYCEAELKGASYSVDHVAPQLFMLEFKNEQQFKQYLRVSLFALKQYCECILKHLLVRSNISQYRSFVLMLSSDAEWLLANHETFNKGVKDLNLSVGATRTLSPLDLKFSMNELFTIDNCRNLASFDFRDVKPNVMFIIRQLLETLGQNLIGYKAILNSSGKPIHKFTQAAWDFINNNQTVLNAHISLPFKISSIVAVNNWSNSFVHARHLHMCYVQFYAVDMVNRLMVPPKVVPKNYDGKSVLHTNFGDFKIT